MHGNKNYISALTIAGSDSCGGAGIQADIKTLSALGCYACSVVTAVTAQNTLGVQDVMTVPADMVAKQLRAVLDDIRPMAVKSGMLDNELTIAAIADTLIDYPPMPFVVDPVMVSTSGRPLMTKKAVSALVERLLPLATLLTPNLPEAETLACMTISTDTDLRLAARRILDMGCQAVLIKGGHCDTTEKTDWLFTKDGASIPYRSISIDTVNSHGTGCTLSAAITAGLARGLTLTEAVSLGKRYISQALMAGKDIAIGHGHGPVNHFFNPQKLIIQS